MDIAGFGRCEGKKKDCFAYLNGRCRALCDGDFKKKDCPFYKTKQQKALEDKEEQLWLKKHR